MVVVTCIAMILFTIAALVTSIGIGLAGLGVFIWTFSAVYDMDEIGFHPPIVWNDGSIWVKHSSKHVTLKKNSEDENDQ